MAEPQKGKWAGGENDTSDSLMPPFVGLPSEYKTRPSYRGLNRVFNMLNKEMICCFVCLVLVCVSVGITNRVCKTHI